MIKAVDKIHPVLCLMGPTASGKTGLAVSLVQRFPLEIVSVDSVMVYRGLNIGSAKPESHILSIAPHSLINVCDPSEIYSAALFRQQAIEAIHNIIQKGRIPLLVGGTMLYFHTLVKGMAPLPAADVEVRAEIEKEACDIGWQGIHKRLKKIDPAAASRIKPNDSQRLQRAVEVWMLTGKTLTDFHQEQKESADDVGSFRFINIALLPNDRGVLHERIARRFHLMIETGFESEMRCLKQNNSGLKASLPSMRSAGYRQMWQYLDEELDYDSMIEKSIVATRQLAKRQLTWLRRWPDLRRFDCLSSKLLNEVSIFLRQLSLQI